MNFRNSYKRPLTTLLIFRKSCCKFLSISHRQKVHHIHIEIFANLQPEEIHFDSVSTNKTEWPRQVREVISDSDSEILDFWSLDEKNNWEIFCIFCIFCIFYIFCLFCIFCILCLVCIFRSIHSIFNIQQVP